LPTSQQSPIHIWAPELSEGSGGIQALSRSYLSALCDASPGRPITVFIKNDQLGDDDPLLNPDITFRSVCHWPPFLRTLALTLTGIYYGLKERPALALTMHLHFLPLLVLLRKLHQTKVACVLHGIEIWQAKGRLRVESLRHADLLIAVSQHTAEVTAEKHQVAASSISIVSNTFNEERYTVGPKPGALLAQYNLQPDQPVLLTISRLAMSERYKGHERVLESLPEVRKHFPKVRYLIGGTGDYSANLRSRAEELGVSDLVTFTGFIPNEELCAHYQLCDIFVMPSQKEGFGIVFLEAMACGKPVIAGNLDGSVDALDGGRLGVLVNPNESEEIQHAVISLLEHSHPNRLLFDPAALHQEVVKTFGPEAFNRRVKEAFTPLLRAAGEPALDSPITAPNSPSAESPTPRLRIVVLTQLTSPYQVEFFNAFADLNDCELTVIYLTSQDRSRKWKLENIRHPHIILSQTPELKDEATRLLLTADMTVFNYYTDLFALHALSRRARTGKPWVFWGERPGFLQIGPPSLWFRRLVLHSLHQSSVPIWGVGQFGIEGYRSEFGKEHPYSNMPYFSDLSRFLEIKPTGKPARPRTLLYSGVLSKRKGADLLAKAFAKIAEEDSTVRLCIVGDGPEKITMETILASCSDRVEWAGFQEWQDLPRFYSKGDLFCFPSRYDGWGLALVEALASGLPVIATDQTGSAIDLISHGHNGWLVKADDLNALVIAIRDALSVPAEPFSEMKAAARQSVKDQSVKEGARKFITEAQHAVKQWMRA
jgi:glycosyltransferase involved in cell wall biosynthesis